MAKTEVRGGQIKDGDIKRKDLNVTSSGQATITKAIPGTGLLATSSGVDIGTGDVTFNLDVPISIANGGTGQSTRQSAIDALTDSINSSDRQVLVSNGTNVSLEYPPNYLSFIFGGDLVPYISTNKTSYTIVGSFVFPGTSVFGAVTKISAVVATTASGVTGQIRIFDPATNLTISTSPTFNNTPLQLIVFGAITNLPANEARLEIQMLRSGGGGTARSRLYGLNLQR